MEEIRKIKVTNSDSLQTPIARILVSDAQCNLSYVGKVLLYGENVSSPNKLYETDISKIPTQNPKVETVSLYVSYDVTKEFISFVNGVTKFRIQLRVTSVSSSSNNVEIISPLPYSQSGTIYYGTTAEDNGLDLLSSVNVDVVYKNLLTNTNHSISGAIGVGYYYNENPGPGSWSNTITIKMD